MIILPASILIKSKKPAPGAITRARIFFKLNTADPELSGRRNNIIYRQSEGQYYSQFTFVDEFETQPFQSRSTAKGLNNLMKDSFLKGYLPFPWDFLVLCGTNTHTIPILRTDPIHATKAAACSLQQRNDIQNINIQNTTIDSYFPSQGQHCTSLLFQFQKQ